MRMGFRLGCIFLLGLAVSCGGKRAQKQDDPRIDPSPTPTADGTRGGNNTDALPGPTSSPDAPIASPTPGDDGNDGENPTTDPGDHGIRGDWPVTDASARLPFESLTGVWTARPRRNSLEGTRSSIVFYRNGSFDFRRSQSTTLMTAYSGLVRASDAPSTFKMEVRRIDAATSDTIQPGDVVNCLFAIEEQPERTVLKLECQTQEAVTSFSGNAVEYVRDSVKNACLQRFNGAHGWVIERLISASNTSSTGCEELERNRHFVKELSLALGGNGDVDVLQPLVGMKKLERLSIDLKGDTSMLSALAQLEGLKHLRINSYLQLRDSSLIFPKGLETLELLSTVSGGCMLTRFASLDTFRSLKKLRVEACTLSSPALTFPALPELEGLYLSSLGDKASTKIVSATQKVKELWLDAGDLASLPQLKSVEEARLKMGLGTEESAKYFSSLRKVTIGWMINSYSFLLGLAQFGKIESIEGVLRSNLYGTTKFESVREFILAPGSTISTLSSLRAFPNLRLASLRNTSLHSLAGIEAVPQLEALDVAGNFIFSIDELASLQNLKRLRMERNSIQSIATLSKLSKLEELTIEENSIKDLAPLANLQNLRVVEAKGNLIEDVDVFAGHPKLKYLDVRENIIPETKRVCPITGADACQF